MHINELSPTSVEQVGPLKPYGSDELHLFNFYLHQYCLFMFVECKQTCV